MSGFEVAGIVLGAFPLAITALDKYREVATRLGLFYKIRLEYKKCRDALEFHQLTFTRHLRQLLLPLVVDDDRIAVLLADPGGDSWRDQAVAGLLRKRLQDSFALYVGYIEGMESVMKRVNRELAADSDAVQERVNAPVGRPSIEDLPLPVLTDTPRRGHRPKNPSGPRSASKQGPFSCTSSGSATGRRSAGASSPSSRTTTTSSRSCWTRATRTRAWSSSGPRRPGPPPSTPPSAGSGSGRGPSSGRWPRRGTAAASSTGRSCCSSTARARSPSSTSRSPSCARRRGRFAGRG